jgi:hypothetical protein
MCQNIRTLFNFEPPATEDEIRASARQFVRKLSGFSNGHNNTGAPLQTIAAALPGYRGAGVNLFVPHL